MPSRARASWASKTFSAGRRTWLPEFVPGADSHAVGNVADGGRMVGLTEAWTGMATAFLRRADTPSGESMLVPVVARPVLSAVASSLGIFADRNQTAAPSAKAAKIHGNRFFPARVALYLV